MSQTTEIHMLIGRTIPNPHERYSTIKAEVGLTVKIDVADMTEDVRHGVLASLQAQLDAVLASEIIRIEEEGSVI